MKTRRYSQLKRLPTFEERFDYLELKGLVGTATFGFNRWLNQQFYTSLEWRSIRDQVLVRDNGCDLGLANYPIADHPLVHHMNPLTQEDIINREDWILDPEFLITVSRRTHNAIHFGGRDLLPRPVVARQPGDTQLW